MSLRKSIIFLMIVLCSCSYLHTEKESFNLKTDLFEFSDRMNEGDTLQIISNLSVCRSIHFEKDLFMKEGGLVYLKTYAEGNFIDDWEENLPKVEYVRSEADSLNYEDLFRYVSRRNTENTKVNTRVLKLIYKGDTICFYSKGLNEQIPASEYILRIKRRIFPDVKLYVPMEKFVVPPPPPPSESM